jgi:hypothetical protein
MNLKDFLKVFIVAFLILSLIVFINSIGLNLNDVSPPKKLLQVVTIEGLTNAPDTSIIFNKNDAFCESHSGSGGSLDDSCGKLTKNNCNSTSCCVWTSENKCGAGYINGPTFNTEPNGKTKQLDYYYFQNKCYGPKCP